MLVKWKLFNKKSTSEKETKPEIKENAQIRSEENLKIDSEEKPRVAEYRETLYSRDHIPKDGTMSTKTSGSTWRRKSWESTNTIEKNIDSFDEKKTSIRTSHKDSRVFDIDKKVDKLVSKTKKQR